MVQAVVIKEYGGPEVFDVTDVEVGDPGPGEIRIRHNSMGLNFRDVYHRNGSYGVPGDKFPAIIGSDGAGVVEAVGDGVDDIKIGDRIAYGQGPMGSYCESRLFPAAWAVPIPDGIDDKTASAVMVKGTTARNLLVDCYPVKAGETILIHAVSGGVGLIMSQWAKHIGASVIGTVSSDEKAELARAHGCDHAIPYEGFPEKVRELTDGQGVPVIFDGVGAATYEGDLDCLAHRGFLIGYGNASGNFPKCEPLDLMRKGSLYMQRMSGAHFNRNREELMHSMDDIFGLMLKGVLRIDVIQTYPLKDAAQAHRDLEARKTSGSVVYTL